MGLWDNIFKGTSKENQPHGIPPPRLPKPAAAQPAPTRTVPTRPAPTPPASNMTVGQANATARTFDEWLDVLDDNAPDTDLGRRAIERLQALAVEFDHWVELLERAENDRALAFLKPECIKGLVEAASSTEEWKRVSEELSNSAPERARAIERLREYIDSIDVCVDLWTEVGEDGLCWPMIKERIKELDVSVDDLASAYDGYSDLDDLTDLLLNEMFRRAESIDDYIRIAEVIENTDNDDEVQKMWDFLNKQEWTEDKWQELYDAAEADSKLEHYANMKVGLHKKDVPAVLEYYKDYMEGDTDDDEITKILDHLFSIATRREIQIMALLAEDDSLRGAAEEYLEEHPE